MQHLPGIGNPPAEIKRPKLPQRHPKYLETPDISKLLNAAYGDKNPDKGLRNWASIAFLYGTGARISEVLSLTFDQIGYRDGEPTSVQVIGKSDKERTVPLFGTAQRALMRWLKVRKVDGHPTSPHVWSYLNGPQRGQPFSRTMQAATTTVAIRVGLDPAKVSLHKIQHPFATALVEQGRSLHEIGPILGHENPATTSICGRVKAQQLAQAAASLPDVLWGLDHAPHFQRSATPRASPSTPPRLRTPESRVRRRRTAMHPRRGRTPSLRTSCRSVCLGQPC